MNHSRNSIYVNTSGSNICSNQNTLLFLVAKFLQFFNSLNLLLMRVNWNGLVIQSEQNIAQSSYRINRICKNHNKSCKFISYQILKMINFILCRNFQSENLNLFRNSVFLLFKLDDLNFKVHFDLSHKINQFRMHSFFLSLLLNLFKFIFELFIFIHS